MATQERFIDLSQSVRLFVKEAGSGPTVVLIPGWLSSSVCYSKQWSILTEHFHVVTYDPPSQGKSSISYVNNHNLQRGRDLHAVLEHLNIKQAHLMGWSDGYFAIASYARQFGSQKIKTVVNIDRPPCGFAIHKNDYAFGNFLNERNVYLRVLHDQPNFVCSLIKSFFLQLPSKTDVALLTEDCLITPSSIAAQLVADDLFQDFSPDTIALTQQVPFLHFIAESRKKQGMLWCKKNIPQAHLLCYGEHMMFWEFPDRFNRDLLQFLPK